MGKRRNRPGVGGSSKTSVDVLLAENVESLGKQGDIVRVKPGYARNYLLPQGLATVATDHNKLMVEKHKQRLAQLEVQKIKTYRERAEAISKYSVTLEANANQEGHLYGSIVAVDIANALKSAGYEVEPQHIKLEGPLKELGLYTVKVRYSSEVEGELKVWVVPAVAGDAQPTGS